MTKQHPIRTRSVAKPTAHELLLEIGTEELPAQFVAPALTELRDRAVRLLKDARLTFPPVTTLGTPRRLTLAVPDLAASQEPMVTTAMGPSKAVGFDAQGQPTKAAVGFAASHGIPVAALEVRTTPKGEYLFAVKRDAGRKTVRVLPDVLEELVTGLSFPKSMRWNQTGVRFGRPVRWLLALYGGKPVRFQFAGVTSWDLTMGHRFLSATQRIKVKDFTSYVKVLEKAHVIVDQERRRAMIDGQLDRLVQAQHGSLHRDDALLEQAVFSVEWPHAVAGKFHPRYLSLPQEVLITAMKEHQGYFSLLAKNGSLLPFFIAVTNMGPRQAAVVQAGNERVLAARLADAQFFFDEDRELRLDARIEQLKGIVFHQRLGTLHDKVIRVVQLSTMLTEGLQASSETIKLCRRAAELYKADLTTGMVGEFPSLQGIMGREYARHDGEPEPVAEAIAEQYRPRFADDSIPASLPGKVLALADRLDTLAAFFAVGLEPSGSEDPFALRRHAYAVIRILVDSPGSLCVDLHAAIQKAAELLKAQGLAVDEKVFTALRDFLVERLRYYCQDVAKLRSDVVSAIVARVLQSSAKFDPADLLTRAAALQAFSSRPEFESLVVAYKRADNITKGTQDDQVHPVLLHTSVEQELATALRKVEEVVADRLEHREYETALNALVSLKAPIDAFFVGVMVMVEEEAVRKNRLALLVRVRELFRRYADFSKIVIP